ncbi:hypothetical protein JW906_02805 [bacterium]|nr:hypothetical protein [bacterium]
MRRLIMLQILLLTLSSSRTAGQDIREYTVRKCLWPVEIDGRLDETDWQNAAFTEPFVKYQDGSVMSLPTRAKFLWDNVYLYIGFVCEDPDVWATMKNRDDHLWNGEVVEILCDPDGNSRNYFEVQVNPLNTVLDLLMDKPYSTGGNADLSWDLSGFKSAISVRGTLNNGSDTDTLWICETALPFSELAFTAMSMSFPPAAGDSWRILVTRYDYERTGDQTVEISSWNQTDSRGFHVPEKFGRIFFTDNSAVSASPAATHPSKIRLSDNYPNPFNPYTVWLLDADRACSVRIAIRDLKGNRVAVLREGSLQPGRHLLVWDGCDQKGRPAASGVYLVTAQAAGTVVSQKITLMR